MIKGTKDLSFAIAVVNSLVDFKVVIRKGYVSTSSKFKITDKEENKKNKKFGGGVASCPLLIREKLSHRVDKVKMLNCTLLVSFIMDQILLESV